MRPVILIGMILGLLAGAPLRADPSQAGYAAARGAALQAATEARYLLAGLWLRRALMLAPTPEARDQTIADAQIVRDLSPWAIALSGSVVPSSNLNGGALSEEVTAPGNPVGRLSRDALALAGWQASFGISARYRLTQSARHRLQAGLAYHGTRVRITDATTLPDQSLATDLAQVWLDYDQILAPGTVGWQLGYARQGYGRHDPVSGAVQRSGFDLWQIGIDQRLPLAQAGYLDLRAAHSRAFYDDPAIGLVRRDQAGLTFGRVLAGGDLLAVSADVGQSRGENRNFTQYDDSLQISYDFAQPVGPVALQLGAGLVWTDYPDYVLLLPVRGGRQDKSLFASADLGFAQISFAGFTPTLALRASRTDSNVSRFTRDGWSAELRIGSSF